MRTATEWFQLYGVSHRNPVNKAIHWVCIPVIVLSTLGLFQAIPHPFGATGAHWGMVVAAASLVFYARLSWTVAVGMAGVAGTCLAINAAIASAGLPILGVSLTTFVVAWVAQFVGHRIEGEKPSFFQDLQFLMIGPAWLLQFVYRQVGIPVETWRIAARA
jgi:uncharacterized membrane protein YGL010W